jgi:imidazolonepropionase-like amidohydrolase
MVRRIYLSVIIITLPLFWISLHARMQGTQPSLVIEGGTRIDVNGGAPVSDSLIVIQGNRITNVSRKGQIAYPPGAEVVKADGKFIVPGFWEAETVYVWHGGESSLIHGVTSVSDIATKAEVGMLHREAVNRGKIGGPRTVIGTGYLAANAGTGFETPLERAQVPKSAEEARQIARRFIDAGSDMVMFFDGRLPVEYFQAAYDEANKAGKATVARASFPVGPKEAVLAGARHLSHSAGIDRAIAKDGSKWTNELDRYSDMDEAKAADLIKFLVQYNVSLSPTLLRKGAGLHKETERFLEQDRRWWLSNPELRAYYPEHFFQSVLAENTPGPLEPAVKERRLRGYNNALQFHARFVQAGGRLLAGCNSPNVCPPGLGLHQELEVFAAAGLTPMQLLQAATKWPAETFKVQDKLGSIEEGKLADLVILNADPLRSGRNLMEIDKVVFDGKVQDRKYHASYRTPFLGGDGFDGNIVVQDLPWVVALKSATQGGGGGEVGSAGQATVRVYPPGIETISPYLVTEGDPTLTLTIKGVNFIEGSLVYFDNVVVPSRRISSTELRATIDGSLLRRAGRFDIFVRNQAPIIMPGWRAPDGSSNKAHFLVNFRY